MKQRSKVASLIKKNWVEILLAVSAILMCIVHAIPAGLNADFWPINGDFQNYNVVRRFLDGQTVYDDFTAYLGYGHLFFGSFLTFIFGKGSPTLMSSKMAFQFASTFAFAIWAYAIFRAVFNKRSRLIPLVAVNIFLMLLLVNPDVFVNALSFSGDFYYGMQYALSTGNSARFLREVAPVLFVAISILLYYLKKKIRYINKSDALSLAFVFGIPAGIIFYYSNDYGVASTISITVIIFIAVLFDKTKLSVKIKKFLMFLGVMIAAFVLFGIIISHGHFANYLTTTFGTGGAQGWYYNSGKSYYFWDMDLSFWSCIQALVVLTYLFILIRRGFSKENIIRYGIPMFFNMAAYEAANEYKLLSGNMLHEVSYTVLYLTIWAEGISLVDSLLDKEKRPSIPVKRIIACIVAFSGMLWSISLYVPLQTNLLTANRGTYVKNLGYFSNKGLARSIESTSEFLNDDDIVFSTYASGLEAYRDQFQPSGTDYIIHVLGNDARTKYLKSFAETNPNYVATIRETYADWEYWVKNANWFFYRELYQNYTPEYANDYQLFWTKSEDNRAYDNNRASLSIENLDDRNIKISIDAPGVTFGEADVSLKYNVEKVPCKRSLFTFNTMVFVNNENAFNLSGNDHDKFYYLANTGDGTPNTSIGIPIINGTGSITLTSEPEQNTRFEDFDAVLQGIYDSGYFNSAVVLNTEVNGNQYRLTLANTPENQKITENALMIRIGDKEYKAKFSTSDDGNAIVVDTQSLEEESIQKLLGHIYYPVIQVVRADYPHVSSLTDDNWVNGVSRNDPRVLLFENDPGVLEELSAAKCIQCGTNEFSIISIEENGEWIHVTVDQDASVSAFPSELTIK